MATSVTPLGTLIESIITVVKTDAVATGLPVVNNFFQSVAANPSTSNVAAQLAALDVNLLAAVPNLEAAVTKDIAALLQTEVQALAAQTEAPPTTAPAS